MEAHDAAVRSIARQVKLFSEQRKPFRIYHGSTNSTRRSTRRPDNTIDTSALTRILSVSAATRTALVEPNVAMDALVDAALPHGLVPPVVMEFPGITAGGGFSGMAGESSSFRHGAFDATMRSVEIVLPADGRVVRASRTHMPDLFWGAASAFGTLGVVTLLEVELRDAAAYVALTYSLARSSGETLGVMRDAAGEEGVGKRADYIDGIVFRRDATVVCVGRMTDDLPPGQTARRFTGRADPWFYIRAEEVLAELEQQRKQQDDGTSSFDKSPPQIGGEVEKITTPTTTVTDYIPLPDYLFRYDRGGFWVGRFGFEYFRVPFTSLTRRLLDRYLRARTMYRALHGSGLADTYIVQDVGVPYDRVNEFSDWLDDNFAIYPLWLCPLRVQRDSGRPDGEATDTQHGLHAAFGRPGAPSLMNFGIWGRPKARAPSKMGSGGGKTYRDKGMRWRAELVARNRELEREVAALGGYKWLYAHAYYPEEEFWARYDRESYDALRERYGAGHLPSVYDKVWVDGRKIVDAGAGEGAGWRARLRYRAKEVWPVRGLHGLYKATVGGDYLMRKK